MGKEDAAAAAEQALLCSSETLPDTPPSAASSSASALAATNQGSKKKKRASRSTNKEGKEGQEKTSADDKTPTADPSSQQDSPPDGSRMDATTTNDEDTNNPQPPPKKKKEEDADIIINDTEISTQDVLCGPKGESDPRVPQRLIVALSSRLFLEPGAIPTSRRDFCANFYAAVTQQKGGRFLMGNDNDKDGNGWRQLSQEAALNVMAETLQQAFPEHFSDKKMTKNNPQKKEAKSEPEFSSQTVATGSAAAAAALPMEHDNEENEEEEEDPTIVQEEDLEQNDILVGRYSIKKPQSLMETVIKPHIDKYRNARNKAKFCQTFHAAAVTEGHRFLAGRGSGVEWTVLGETEAVAKIKQGFANHSVSLASQQGEDGEDESEEEDDDDDEPPAKKVSIHWDDINPKKDILCGKLKRNIQHSLKNEMAPFLKRFDEATKMTQFCKGIYAECMSQGRRFLERDGTDDDMWTKVDKEAVLQKMAGVFRNIQSSQYFSTSLYDQLGDGGEEEVDSEDSEDSDEEDEKDDEESSKASPNTKAITLREHDIICGRFKPTKDEDDQLRLVNKLVKPNVKEYNNEEKKSGFCLSLVERAMAAGSRFVEKARSGWVALSKDEALLKLETSFRNYMKSHGWMDFDEEAASVKGERSTTGSDRMVGDILCGIMGKPAATDPQSLWNKVILPHLDDFGQASNKLKYVQKLTKRIVADGGRFLQRPKKNSDEWIEMPKDEISTKVYQAFYRAFSDSSNHKSKGHSGKRGRVEIDSDEESSLDGSEDENEDEELSAAVSLRGLEPKDIACGVHGYVAKNLPQSLLNKGAIPHLQGFQQAQNKAEFCQLVAKDIVEAGGRFVQQSKKNKDQWIEMPTKSAGKKLYQCLIKLLSRSLNSGEETASSSQSLLRASGTAGRPSKRSRSTGSKGRNEEEYVAAKKLEELCNKFDKEGGDAFVIPFVRSGGIEDTLKSLEKFSGAPYVQANGLCLLCKVVMAKKDVVVFLQCAEQCIKLSIHAMKLFSMDPDVCMNAVELVGLVWDGMEASKMLETAGEMIPFLKVEISGDEAPCKEVLQQGLFFLWKISATKEGRDAILNSRVDEDLQSFWHHPSVQGRMKKDLWALQQRIMQDYGSSSRGDKMPKFEFD